MFSGLVSLSGRYKVGNLQKLYINSRLKFLKSIFLTLEKLYSQNKIGLV